MHSDAVTIADYISQLPAQRQDIITQLVDVITDNLPDGFEATMANGMVGFVVPLQRYPAGYHCTPDTPLPFMNVASQKNHIAVYHMGVYSDSDLRAWYEHEYSLLNTGRKLDMGASCIRFKKPEHVPVELIGQLASKLTVDQWIERYEAARA